MMTARFQGVGAVPGFRVPRLDCKDNMSTENRGKKRCCETQPKIQELTDTQMSFQPDQKQ